MTPNDLTTWPRRTKPEAPAGFFSRCTSKLRHRTITYRICTESVEELAALRHMEKGP